MANFNFNKVILGGRLTATPELKMTQSGTAVVSFNLAVNRRFVPKKEDGSAGDPQTDFISCVAWKQSAEFIAKYFSKGSSLCVVGELQTRTYVDKLDVKHYVTEVRVDEAYFVDAKGDIQKAAPAAPAAAPDSSGQAVPYNPYSGDGTPQFEVLENEEELPF